jgi:hypothetical protein
MNKIIAMVGVVVLAALMLGSVAGAGIGNTQFAVYLIEPALHPDPQAFTYVGETGDIGSFGMPVAPQYISYLQEKLTSLSVGDTVTATFTIPSSAGFSGNPDGGDSAINFVRFFFKAQLPEGQNTGSISGLNAYTYWWSNPVAYNFGPTDASPIGTTTVNGGSITVETSSSSITVTLVVTVDQPYWSDIYGGFGNTNSSTSAGFNEALGSITYIGLSFGSNYFFANGVGVTSGPVVFELNAFTVSPPTS